MYTDEEEEDYVLSSKYINKQIFALLLQVVFSLPLKQTSSPHAQYISLTLSAWMERKNKTKQITFIAWERAKTFIKKIEFPFSF